MSGLEYLGLLIGTAIAATLCFIGICHWYRKKHVRNASMEMKLLWAGGCVMAVCLLISLVQTVDGYHVSERDLAREMGMDG